MISGTTTRKAYLCRKLITEVIVFFLFCPHNSEVNGNKTHKYNLKTLNSFFYDKENKEVKIKLQRKGQVLEKTFLLKSPLKKTALVQN